MIISEITRLNRTDYQGGSESLDGYDLSSVTFAPLPGSQGFAYGIQKAQYGGSIHILIVDQAKRTPYIKPLKWGYEFIEEYQRRVARSKRQYDKIGVLVGKLVLDPMTSIPLPNPMQVDTITTHEKYRGMGLAKSMYTIAMTTLKATLVSGDSQTPGGRRNWIGISSMPGVEVKGLLKLSEYELDTDPANNEFDYKTASKTIDTVMGKLGGQYIGDKDGDHYFAFDVVPGKAELAPYVKTQLSQIYGSDWRAGNEVLLYARWVGKQ